MNTIDRFMLYFFCIEIAVAFSSRPINWSKATIKSVSNNERIRYHPAYNEVTPAFCDLTEYCDFCCSDPDCSETDKESFTCTSVDEMHSDYDALACQKQHPHSMQSGWFQLLCYVTAKSPYLGHYFTERKKIISLSSMKTLLEQKERKNSFYDDTNLPVNTASSRNSQYMYGEPVRLTWNTGSDFSPRYTSYLELPHNLLSVAQGSCIISQAVKYLVNSASTCVRKIAKEICNGNLSSYLSVAQYALLGDEDLFTVFQLPVVAKGKLSADVPETRTQYLCLKNGSDYVTFSKNIFMNTEKNPDQSDSEVSDDFNTTVCEDVNDQLLSVYYNESTNVCENVLVSADYKFVWKGSEIERVNVVYKLADIPLPGMSSVKGKGAAAEVAATVNSPIPSEKTEQYITQQFSTLFKYYSENSSTYNETTGY